MRKRHHVRQWEKEEASCVSVGKGYSQFACLAMDRLDFIPCEIYQLEGLPVSVPG